MKEYYDKEKEEIEKQNNMMNNKSSKDISRPNIAPAPNYTAKVPKK
jgi:hypothetical protein